VARESNRPGTGWHPSGDGASEHDPAVAGGPGSPQETKLSLREDPEEGRTALLELGLSWEDAGELAGAGNDPTD
jgi:hypothetical protein